MNESQSSVMGTVTPSTYSVQVVVELEIILGIYIQKPLDLAFIHRALGSAPKQLA